MRRRKGHISTTTLFQTFLCYFLKFRASFQPQTQVLLYGQGEWDLSNQGSSNPSLGAKYGPSHASESLWSFDQNSMSGECFKDYGGFMQLRWLSRTPKGQKHHFQMCKKAPSISLLLYPHIWEHWEFFFTPAVNLTPPEACLHLNQARSSFFFINTQLFHLKVSYVRKVCLCGIVAVLF